MKRGWGAALAAMMLVVASPAAAQEKSAVRPDLLLKPGTARILLIRPKITVGAQSTGGMFEPNADWTQQARENLGAALSVAQTKLGNAVVVAPDPVGAKAAQLAAYQALFSVVADSVIEYQFFKGNRLPTKKRAGQFDWTLGRGVADIGRDSGCDYALFLITDDQYGSTGRKVLQVFAAMARVSVPVGVHKGFAGLVDLKTGDLVWLNADLQMGGDVRTADGATRRMGQLLAGFPGGSVTADGATQVAAK
jgi:hypothetical protein